MKVMQCAAATQPPASQKISIPRLYRINEKAPTACHCIKQRQRQRTIPATSFLSSSETMRCTSPNARVVVCLSVFCLSPAPAVTNASALAMPRRLDATHTLTLFKHTKEHTHTTRKKTTQSSVDRQTRRQSVTNRTMSTATTGRVPLNDGENLAVGAFGGIVETVVQST